MTRTQLMVLAWIAPALSGFAFVCLRTIEALEGHHSRMVRALALFAAIVAVVALVVAVYSGDIVFDGG